MGMVWIVLLDFIISIIALFAIQSIFLVVKLLSFETPFTNELISNGIIKPTIKAQLLGVQWASSLTTILICNGLCIFGAWFTRPSGFVVYGIVAFIGLVLLPPTKDKTGMSERNIREYVAHHYICMDMEQFKNIYGEY